MATEVFHPEEIALIIQFCESIGMEYGELDILRDNHNSLIYIVDANNTPMGPPNGISSHEKDLAVRMIADALRRNVLQY